MLGREQNPTGAAKAAPAVASQFTNAICPSRWTSLRPHFQLIHDLLNVRDFLRQRIRFLAL
jgi:hypothetical protein